MSKLRSLICSTAAALTVGTMASPTWATVVAMTVGDVSTGNYNLTSLSVQRGTAGILTYEPHQLINVKVTDVDAYGQQLLLPRGAPLPPAGSRAQVLEDWAVNTGINNITTVNGTPDRSLEVTFTRPVINSEGPDIVLIETGGDDGFRWWINDDRANQGADAPINAYSQTLMFGIPVTAYQFGNGSQSILGLDDLESPTGWSFGSDFSRDLRAMSLDLSSVGVPLGGSVTSIRLQSFAGNQRVDPVLIVGLPVVPEPGGLAMLGLAAGALMRRRRHTGSFFRLPGTGAAW